MKKAYRILQNREFSSIINAKKAIRTPVYVVYYAPKKLEHIRVGISVSKKLGKAHIRNRIKRQIRMMANELFHWEDDPFDCIIIPRINYLDRPYADNKKDLENILKKVKIKRKSNQEVSQ